MSLFPEYYCPKCKRQFLALSTKKDSFSCLFCGKEWIIEEKDSMSEKIEETPVSNPVGGVGIPLSSHYEPKDEVICQYKGNCSDKGYCCKTCKNNTGKKSHYIPEYW